MSTLMEKINGDAELDDDDLDSIVEAAWLVKIMIDTDGTRVNYDSNAKIISRLVDEIKMLRNQKHFVRLSVHYEEEDGLIPKPYSPLVESGDTERLVEVGDHTHISWYDAETETRIDCMVKVEGIEVE